MRRLAGVVLGVSSAIAMQTAGFAQVVPETANSTEKVPAVQTSSEFLQIEPISVDRSTQATDSSSNKEVYDKAHLKTISESLRAKPDAKGNLLNNIPTDLIHTPSSSSVENSAIDFFQVPPPSPSVGININTQ